MAFMQPPSGGCVLKLCRCGIPIMTVMQPPSGGCVLKLTYNNYKKASAVQPPSGGCVLKLNYLVISSLDQEAAAFGRLCVETFLISKFIFQYKVAAAFGRLCVETCHHQIAVCLVVQPPSGGCVLKPHLYHKPF